MRGDAATRSSTHRSQALLLDIGGVLLISSHERMADLDAPADFTEVRGLLGPRPDPAWDDVLTGRGRERAYWAARAAEYGALCGGTGTVPELMAVLYPDDEPFRPEVIALMDDAHRAGLTVAALTNDLAAFHGDADLTRHPVLGRFDVIVDGSVTGVLKPDPRAYAHALEVLDAPPDAVVFLDDLPGNCAGARAAGIVTVEVDLRDPAAAVARARDLLALRAAA
jgi:putative hydrolase of the HAD superfamily